MPDKLQVLQICGSKFSFEGLGKQFSNAYPNLKRFSYYVGDGEECMFDADFFVGFKELQVIETECHKNAKIILPDSLKVLNLSCSTEEVDSSEGHINHDKYKGEEIKESEKRECCNYLNCQTILKNVLQRDKGCTYFKQLIDLVRYRKSQEY
uniref:Uncharacterized protein n=1 Tax=Rhabditophanes sp. KR3021 TaxID=114890 RepID=A0AC35TGZ6_9BILA